MRTKQKTTAQRQSVDLTNEPLLRAPRPWPAWKEAKLPADFADHPFYGQFVHRGYLAGVKQTWQNGWFAVLARPVFTAWGEVTHIMITNLPNTPVRDWTDLQRIKNELFGESRTAVEVFPPEDAVVNQANMTHLWLLPEGMSLPFSL